MRNRILLIIFILHFIHPIAAQNWEWWPLELTHSQLKGDTLLYQAEILGVTSSGTYAPFWLQSNCNGNISAAPHSGNISAGIYKPATQPHRWYDYDFAVQLTGRIQDDIPTPFTPYKNRLFPL